MRVLLYLSMIGSLWGQSVSKQVFTAQPKTATSVNMPQNGQISHQIVVSSASCAGGGSVVTLQGSVDNVIWTTLISASTLNNVVTQSWTGAYPYIHLVATVANACLVSVAYFGTPYVTNPVLMGTGVTGATTPIQVEARGAIVDLPYGFEDAVLITTDATTPVCLTTSGKPTIIGSIVVGVAGTTSTATLKVTGAGATIAIFDTTKLGVYPITFRCTGGVQYDVVTTSAAAPATISVLRTQMQ